MLACNGYQAKFDTNPSSQTPLFLKNFKHVNKELRIKIEVTNANKLPCVQFTHEIFIFFE